MNVVAMPFFMCRHVIPTVLCSDEHLEVNVKDKNKSLREKPLFALCIIFELQNMH